MKTDLEILDETMKRYRQTEDLSPQERLTILSNLEYYLHQVRLLNTSPPRVFLFVFLKFIFLLHLVVLRHSLSIYCRWAFVAAVPAAFNTLSDELHDPVLSTDSFRCLPQTRLFSEY